MKKVLKMKATKRRRALMGAMAGLMLTIGLMLTLSFVVSPASSMLTAVSASAVNRMTYDAGP